MNTKIKLATGATVVALGGLAGLALGEGGRTESKAVAEKPLVRTKVIRQTVHVTKHAKPKHPAAAAGGSAGAAAGASGAAGSASTGASSTGSSASYESGTRHDFHQRRRLGALEQRLRSGRHRLQRLQRVGRQRLLFARHHLDQRLRRRLDDPGRDRDQRRRRRRRL